MADFFLRLLRMRCVNQLDSLVTRSANGEADDRVVEAVGSADVDLNSAPAASEDVLVWLGNPSPSQAPERQDPTLPPFATSRNGTKIVICNLPTLLGEGFAAELEELRKKVALLSSEPKKQWLLLRSWDEETCDVVTGLWKLKGYMD